MAATTRIDFTSIFGYLLGVCILLICHQIEMYEWTGHKSYLKKTRIEKQLFCVLHHGISAKYGQIKETGEGYIRRVTEVLKCPKQSGKNSISNCNKTYLV